MQERSESHFEREKEAKIVHGPLELLLLAGASEKNICCCERHLDFVYKRAVLLIDHVTYWEKTTVAAAAAAKITPEISLGWFIERSQHHFRKKNNH